MVGEKIKTSVRMDTDVLDELRELGVDVAQYIRDAVDEKIARTKEPPEERAETLPFTPMTGKMPDRPILDDMPRVKPTRKFEMPVGDVICAGTEHEQVRLWWMPMTKLHEITDIVKELDGFRLKIGEEGKGSWYMPEVIEEDEQERIANGAFCVSCHMIPAYKGDRMVWLEILDPEAALETMRERTDIPCPVRVDVHKYTDRPEYAECCDKANALFTYWWKTGHPKYSRKTRIEDIPITELYDV